MGNLAQNASGPAADVATLHAQARDATDTYLKSKGIDAYAPQCLAPIAHLLEWAATKDTQLGAFAAVAEAPRAAVARKKAVGQELQVAARDMVYGRYHQAAKNINRAHKTMHLLGLDMLAPEAVHDVEQARDIVSHLEAGNTAGAAAALVAQISCVAQRGHHESQVQIPALRATLSRTLRRIGDANRYFPTAADDALLGSLLDLLCAKSVYGLPSQDRDSLTHQLRTGEVPAPERYAKLVALAQLLRSEGTDRAEAADAVQLLADSCLRQAVWTLRDPAYVGEIPPSLYFSRKELAAYDSQGKRAFAQFSKKQKAPPFAPADFMRFLQRQDLTVGCSKVELLNIMYQSLNLPAR